MQRLCSLGENKINCEVCSIKTCLGIALNGKPGESSACIDGEAAIPMSRLL
jgi:hypothetical protein